MPSADHGKTSHKLNEKMIGVIGKTPITRIGLSWIPITQLVLWGIFTRSAAKRKPDSSRIQWSREGLFEMELGSPRQNS